MQKESKQALKDATALNSPVFSRRLLDVLNHNDPAHEQALAAILKERWQDIKTGKSALSFGEFASVLEEMNRRGLSISPEKAAPPKGGATPLSQRGFYDAVRAREIDAAKLATSLETLYKEQQNKKGFLARNFNLFASKDPVAKALTDIEAFDKHCRENGIAFDAEKGELAAGQKPKTIADTIIELRFALAAIGGMAVGLVGVDLATVPVLEEAPGLFFSKGLPWLAGAFIGLNVFKAFSEYSIIRESSTLGRFAAITAAGFAVSYCAVAAMTSLFPPGDGSAIRELVTDSGGGGGGFNPMQYMLYLVAGMTGFAAMYKGAKARIEGGYKAVTGEGGVFSRLRQNAAALAFNRVTAPPVKMTGDALLKGAEFINKAFPAFINYIGIPAVAVLLSHTMAEGGVGQLAQYGHYYATAFAGLIGGTALMLAGYYALGCRGKDFGQIMSAYKEGFFISSSSATLPKEKVCLTNIGVTEKTTDSVLPLAGVFNMYGTSLYLGLTAFYGLNMFGNDPGFMEYLNTAAMACFIALGAPGIPASNIALLEPVLQQTGMTQSQISKIYAMVLPMDRLLDMKQTGMNVMGDMFAAVWRDRHVLKERNFQRAQQGQAPGPEV